MSKSQRIPAQQWVPSGNDFVIDGLWGRLGAQEQFGSTRISGSANGLAVRVDEAAGKVYVYAGASNGGVHLRVYDSTLDRWDDTWSWQSRPGSGYEGSQAIAVLAVSDDGQYLAAAQGNPSNYQTVAPPSRGVQIGRINGDGSISWLPVEPAAAQNLAGLNVRSLKWDGSSLLGTTWSNLDRVGKTFQIQWSADGIQTANISPPSKNNLVLDHQANNTLKAGYSALDYVNQLELNDIPVVGDRYEQLIQEMQSEGLAIGRVSLYPRLVNGNVVAFLGSYRYDPSKSISGPIARIDRLELLPDEATIVDLLTYSVPEGVIGSDSFGTIYLYGNFSFQADPYDPEAMSVFSGANSFRGSPISPASNGGLVGVDFRDLQSGPDLLYGMRSTDAGVVLNPGQPHADSRTIAFYPSSSGPVLLETDDGGIWQLPLEVSSTGASAANGAWWQSLTSKGLSTLELNMATWNSHTNAIASSYQDNAASLGYYGENHATNFWAGDGQVALFDEAGKGHKVNGYLASQQYIGEGSWSKNTYDKDGFIEGQKTSPFFLQQSKSSPDSIIAWSETDEAYNQDEVKKAATPYMLPVEVNAYRPDSIVMTGQYNVYETIKPDRNVRQQNGLLFRPLLSTQFQFHPTSIDNQGSAGQGVVESLYVGARIPSGNTLYGRQSSNRASDYELKPLEFSNLSASELSQYGEIVDIAHSPTKNQEDTIYWLQGGQSIPFSDNSSTDPEKQVLHIGKAGGHVSTYNLVDYYGIPLSEGDQYGQQALVYVPATKSHSAKLVIGGQQGIWSSDLGPDGTPVGFSQMDWQGLPDQGPGSYVRNIIYDPQDDLLIAATQGQGIFLYSFSGKLGRRPKPTSLLHVSNLDLKQSPTPQVDKRGNEVNATITIALDSRLQDSTEATELRIQLHNPAAWKQAMEYVSLYSDISPEIAEANLLTPEGVATAGGKQNKNAITVPLSMAPGSTMFNLIVNAEETDVQNRLKPLKYSVSLADGSEKLTRRVKFIPVRHGTKSPSVNRTALERADAITGLDDSQPALFDPSTQGVQSLAGRITVTSHSDQDLICGFYWVQNADGAVLSEAGQLLQPGDPGYAAAALRDSNLAVSFASADNTVSQSELIQPNHGGFLAPYAKVNGEILFAVDANGAAGTRTFKALGSGTIGFEDYAANGTVDFTDLTLKYQAVPLA